MAERAEKGGEMQSRVETRERPEEWNKSKMEGDRWAPAKVKMVFLDFLSAKITGLLDMLCYRPNHSFTVC
jgi:hypothetical protein